MAALMAGSDPEATILWGNGEEKSGNVVMVPATLGGYPVTTVGNGAQTISSNNKNDDVYVLFPEGVTTFSPRMIYDYNSTSGWSIPASVTSIADGTFLSCPGTFYGQSGSAAETYAASDSTRDFVTYGSDESLTFTAEVGEDGYMQPNGTYYLPSGMLDGNHTVTFRIVADLSVQGQSPDGGRPGRFRPPRARTNTSLAIPSPGILPASPSPLRPIRRTAAIPGEMARPWTTTPPPSTKRLWPRARSCRRCERLHRREHRLHGQV